MGGEAVGAGSAPVLFHAMVPVLSLPVLLNDKPNEPGESQERSPPGPVPVPTFLGVLSCIPSCALLGLSVQGLPWSLSTLAEGL